MGLMEIFYYGFVQRALLAGALIASVSALLGLFLILRRFSLIGDGLAHSTFGSVAVVLLIGVSPFYITLAALPLVMVSSLAIYKLTSSRTINADAAIGMISSLGIAIGIILASLSGGFNVDLFSYLFGNILTVNNTELLLSFFVFAGVLFVVVYFYDELFAITFDQELAQSMGVKTGRMNVILFLLTARRNHACLRFADSSGAYRSATFHEISDDNDCGGRFCSWGCLLRNPFCLSLESSGRRNDCSF